MERLFTIGAYDFTPEMFFGSLEGERIDLFIDLRRRRGVRGPLYTFANAGRLQEELRTRGIPYRHVLDLAPDESTREIQDQHDRAQNTPRRQRKVLSQAFVDDYTARVLDRFDWTAFTRDLAAFQRPVLFCVERDPEACHRNLVAGHLQQLTGVAVTHLVP
jgi:uncharacterized protein (DUF488 family)